ncbi:MAG: hypothetical protein ACTIMB_01090, partial [Brachybacterium alimentarium]
SEASEASEEASVWGDLASADAWSASSPAEGSAPSPAGAASPDSAPAAPTTGGVRVAPSARVVPLGPAGASPATSPSSVSRSDAAPAAGAGTGAGAGAVVAAGAGAGVVAGTGPAAGTSASPAATYPDYPTPDPYGVPPHGQTGPTAAASAGGPPTVPPEADSDGSGSNGRRALFACGGCLLLALVLVIVGAFVVRALVSDDGEDYQRTSATSAPEAPSESPTEEPTTEEPSEEPVSPAPDDAEDITALHSPTGNIVCLLEDDSVACSVLERDYADASLEDCDNGPFSIQVGAEDAATACGKSFLSDSAQTLEYDKSSAHGDVACTSRFDGMTCWNVMTGHGFTVNKVTYSRF